MRKAASKQPGNTLDARRTAWLLLTLLLSYWCCWALSAGLAVCLLQWRVQPSEAVLISSMAAFVIFPVLAVWLFSTAHAMRNGLLVLSASLMFWACGLYMPGAA
ncbi:hypothetical protein JWR97_12675 [Pseudomonas cedrina subsp. fulgida]|nr:hypothetical protein [Pseudomonas cedrina subsp. fulgida]